jgi:hypothetical protein
MNDERLKSNSASAPGMDAEKPFPDRAAELDEPELPTPPVESIPEDPGGNPGEEPAPVWCGSRRRPMTPSLTQSLSSQPRVLALQAQSHVHMRLLDKDSLWGRCQARLGPRCPTGGSLCGCPLAACGCGSLPVCSPSGNVTRRGSRGDCPARSSTAHLAGPCRHLQPAKEQCVAHTVWSGARSCRRSRSGSSGT